MWEEARPERRRRIDEDRKRQFRHSVIAYSIIFGTIAILFWASMVDRDVHVEPAPAPAPVAQPQSSPRTPETTQPRPRATGPAIPDSSIRQRAPQQPLTNTARGDPSVMRDLTDTCVYWTQQNTRGQYAGNQEMACREMATYAREHGFNAPQVTLRRSGSSTGTTSGTMGARPQIYVNECTGHTYGSVAYRQCRAAEKRRLTNECQRLRGLLDTAQGPGRAELVARTSAACSQANTYRIVQ